MRKIMEKVNSMEMVFRTIKAVFVLIFLSLSLASVTAAAGSVSGNGSYSWSTAGISLTSGIEDSLGVPLNDALIEQVDNPSINTISGLDGSFVLNGLPSGVDFSLKLSKNGYVPTYTQTMNSTSDITSVAFYTLNTAEEVASWGVTPGKGVIRGKLADKNNPTTVYIGGAVVTCTSAIHPGACPYTIKYDNNGVLEEGASTFSNGKFVILNIDGGDTVAVNVSKSGWSFPPRSYLTHADAQCGGRILGTPTGSISGTVTYPGARSGMLYVGLFSSPDIIPGVTSPLYLAAMNSTGLDTAYTISGVSNGTYYVGAIKTNDINAVQLEDSYGMYGIDFNTDFTANPVIKTTAGQVIADINFLMIDGTAQDPNPFYILPGVGTGTRNASGTYTYTPGTGALAWNWTSSDFICDGPGIGQKTETVTSLTATAMTWGSGADTMTWTRASGTAGVITGTWMATDSSTGNTYVLTINANGTVSVTGNIVLCSDNGGGGGGENPKAEAQHWSGGYHVQLRYSDTNMAASAVSVAGPGITGSVELTYNTHMGSWGSGTPESIIALGTTYPIGLPYTYTFTITDATGTWTADSIVSCLQEQFVTNISPAGTVTGTPTFSWTGIADAGAVYGVQVNDSNGDWLWADYFISGYLYCL